MTIRCVGASSRQPVMSGTWSRIALAAVLGVSLSACWEHRQMWAPHRISDAEAAIENNTQLHHPITFRTRNEHLDIELPPAGRGLSHNQRIDAYRFIKRYIAESTEPLAVLAPVGSDVAVHDLWRVVADAGLNPKSVTMSRGSRAGRRIRLAYSRPVAVPPPCPLWYRDAGREPEKVNYPLFGCATQRNIAGMVANARDLMGAQPELPASAERRDRVWSGYVRGNGGGSPAAAAPDTSADAKPKDSAKK